MKRKHVVLALAFVGCAGVLAFADRNPADPIVEAAPRASRHDATPGAGASAGAGAGATASVVIAALRSRADLFSAADGGRHELFASQISAPPLPSAAPPGAEIPPLPTDPIVPFTYVGKQATGGTWEVYLANGDETVIARDQTIIDGTYRVDSIKPPTLTLVYLPLNLVQTIDIGSAD
jgi:hypothetical protein